MSVLLSKIKNLVIPAVIFLITFGLIFLFGKRSWWPSFYSPVFLGWAFFVSAVLIILPKYIFKSTNKSKQDSVVLLRFALAVALVLNGLGEIYLYQLYKVGFQYDKLLHFFNSLLFLIVLTSFTMTWFQLTIKRALTIAVIMVFVGSFLWEFFEFFSDLVFKTAEFGVNGTDKFRDTFFDITFDMIGITVGSIILTNRKLSKKIIKEYCQP